MAVAQPTLQPSTSSRNRSEAAIEAQVRAFAETEACKLGQIAQPLRAALSGSHASPGIFEVMAILGRAESLGRIGDQQDAA